MNHTPGPWTDDGLTKIGTHELDRIVHADAWSIAIVKGDNQKPAEANARLIAAAPELLETAKALIEYLTFTCKEVEEVEAAIAKAEDQL